MSHIGLAEVGTLFDDRAEDLVVRTGREIEVDEAGAGDLDLVDLLRALDMLRDGRGDIARLHVGKLCRAQSHGRGPVAVGRIVRTLEAHISHFECRKVSLLLSRADSGTHQLIEVLGHLRQLLF